SLGDGRFQITDHVGDGTVLRPGNGPHRPPVVFARLNSDGLEQNVLWHVMRMGDERHAHPRLYRLILAADAAGVDAGPEAEDKRAGNRQQESETEKQRPPVQRHSFIRYSFHKYSNVYRHGWIRDPGNRSVTVAAR